jgi:hypothetical protein
MCLGIELINFSRKNMNWFEKGRCPLKTICSNTFVPPAFRTLD